jgi:hypothetical protein
MTTDENCGWLDVPLTLEDYIEIAADALEEAEGNLEAGDFRKLIAAVRKKLDVLADEAEPEEPTPRGDRWWDR